MVDSSFRCALPPALVVAPPPPVPVVTDDVEQVLRRFADLSARAQRQGEPELAVVIDRAGLRAAAARLRRLS
ncbi:hypothetical protein [Methylobacterium sp. JK268]